jgi:hypothetical protein
LKRRRQATDGVERIARPFTLVGGLRGKGAVFSYGGDLRGDGVLID